MNRTEAIFKPDESFKSFCARRAAENNCEYKAIAGVAVLMLMCSGSAESAFSRLDDIIQAYVNERPLSNPTEIPPNFLMRAWDIINGDYSHLMVDFS